MDTYILHNVMIQRDTTQQKSSVCLALITDRICSDEFMPVNLRTTLEFEEACWLN